MKLVEQHPDLFYLVYLPFWILVSIAYVFCAPLIISGLSIQWGFTLVWLAAFFHPNSRMTVPVYEEPIRAWWRWCVDCWLFQAAFLISMMGFAHFFSSNPAKIYHQLITGYALGPMLLFSLVAASVACVFAQGKRPYISSTLSPIFKNTHLDRVGIMADAYIRSSNVVSFGMIVVAIILTLLWLINHHYQITMTPGVNVPMVILLTVFVFIPTHNRFGQLIRPLINHLPYVISILIVAVISIIAAYGIYFVVLSLEPLNTLHPKIFETWDWEQYSLITTFFFMLSWCGPYPGIMVHFAQGYKIRSLLLVSMILPIAWGVWLLWFTPGQWFDQCLPYLTLISCVYLLTLFLRHSRVTLLMRASLPTEETQKQRSAFAYVKGIMMFALLMMGSYFFTGIYLVGYAPFIIIMPVAIVASMGIISLLSLDIA